MELVLERLPVYYHRSGDTKSTYYRNCQLGLDTPPVRIGGRSAARPKHEVDAILAAKINGATPEQLRKLVAELMEQRKALMPASMRDTTEAA